MVLILAGCIFPEWKNLAIIHILVLRMDQSLLCIRQTDYVSDQTFAIESSANADSLTTFTIIKSREN